MKNTLVNSINEFLEGMAIPVSTADDIESDTGYKTFVEKLLDWNRDLSVRIVLDVISTIFGQTQMGIGYVTRQSNDTGTYLILVGSIPISDGIRDSRYIGDDARYFGRQIEVESQKRLRSLADCTVSNDIFDQASNLDVINDKLNSLIHYTLEDSEIDECTGMLMLKLKEHK